MAEREAPGRRAQPPRAAVAADPGRAGFSRAWFFLLVPLAIAAGYGGPFVEFRAAVTCAQDGWSIFDFLRLVIFGPVVTLIALFVVLICGLVPVSTPRAEKLLVLLCVVLLAGVFLLTVHLLHIPTEWIGGDNPVCVRHLAPWWPPFLPS